MLDKTLKPCYLKFTREDIKGQMKQLHQLIKTKEFPIDIAVLVTNKGNIVLMEWMTWFKSNNKSVAHITTLKLMNPDIKKLNKKQLEDYFYYEVNNLLENQINKYGFLVDEELLQKFKRFTEVYRQDQILVARYKSPLLGSGLSEDGKVVLFNILSMCDGIRCHERYLSQFVFERVSVYARVLLVKKRASLEVDEWSKIFTNLNNFFNNLGEYTREYNRCLEVMNYLENSEDYEAEEYEEQIDEYENHTINQESNLTFVTPEECREMHITSSSTSSQIEALVQQEDESKLFFK